MISAAETLKAQIDRVAQANVFSFDLMGGPKPHLELVFSPLNYRVRIDRTLATSIVLAHLAPGRLTLYPELIVPTDRVYMIQLPIPSVDEYRLVLGVAIQSPEPNVLEEELREVQGPSEIIDRLMALEAVLERARKANRLALAYYRF